MAFILVAGPLAPSVFAEETDIQKLEAQLTSELQKVNTKYQEIESLNQQIDSLNKREKKHLLKRLRLKKQKWKNVNKWQLNDCNKFKFLTLFLIAFYIY